MIARLPDHPLDIVGDVHGELAALQDLLGHLGYDSDGEHPQDRRLVFVGDLCDRGPDSPGVLRQVRRLVEAGRAQAVIGNHELNLLRGVRRDGNDWFWDEKAPRQRKYQPWALLPQAEQAQWLSFLDGLPLALERDDLRVAHAAWEPHAVACLREIQPAPGEVGSIQRQFEALELLAQGALRLNGLADRFAAEKSRWRDHLLDERRAPPMLEVIGLCEELRQMGNPIRVLTSGVERRTRQPYFAGGQWRFVERRRWWQDYHEPVPVLIGHYWRSLIPHNRSLLGKRDADLFAEIAPTDWHGACGNVFCVDYSAGARFKERQLGQASGSLSRLAALRWPERTLVTDDGAQHPTQGFGGAG